jgi:hypothetical protein
MVFNTLITKIYENFNFNKKIKASPKFFFKLNVRFLLNSNLIHVLNKSILTGFNQLEQTKNFRKTGKTQGEK